jgi:hypothetical protein
MSNSPGDGKDCIATSETFELSHLLLAGSIHPLPFTDSEDPSWSGAAVAASGERAPWRQTAFAFEYRYHPRYPYLFFIEDNQFGLSVPSLADPAEYRRQFIHCET